MKPVTDLLDQNTERVVKELKCFGMTRETHRALTRTEEFDQNTAAIAYARWLAERDGNPIPANYSASIVRLGDKINAVEFLADGGPRRVEIPNWDWTPNVRTESAPLNHLKGPNDAT